MTKLLDRYHSSTSFQKCDPVEVKILDLRTTIIPLSAPPACSLTTAFDGSSANVASRSSFGPKHATQPPRLVHEHQRRRPKALLLAHAPCPSTRQLPLPDSTQCPPSRLPSPSRRRGCEHRCSSRRPISGSPTPTIPPFRRPTTPTRISADAATHAGAVHSKVVSLTITTPKTTLQPATHRDTSAEIDEPVIRDAQAARVSPACDAGFETPSALRTYGR